MRLRVLDSGVDKYGLNAYIFDSTNDGRSTTTGALLAAKDGAARSRHSRGQWADVKVAIVGGSLAGRPPAC